MDVEVERRRRVHLKSRAGCVNCKARQIKCQETRPSCLNCDRKNLACVYRKPEKAGPFLIVKQPSSGPQWASSQFSMTDMHLFHHFLFSASTVVPSDRSEVWTTQLPRIAHQHEFLLHALLSFGGTHLSTLGCSKDSAVTIQHRMTALHGMSNAMAKIDQSHAPNQSVQDALLATCMLLQLQSTFLTDGCQDYLIMGRGLGILMQRITSCKTFDAWQLQNLRDFIDRRLRLLDDEALAFRSAQAATIAASVKTLEPFCRTANDEEFCAGIGRMCAWLQKPGFQPQGQVGSMWTMFANIPPETWSDFINPESLFGQKLLAHFCALLLLFRPVYEKLQYGDVTMEPLPALTTWIRQMSENIQRLSEAETSRISEANSLDFDLLNLDCAVEEYGDARLNMSAATARAGTDFASAFAPLQVAIACDARGGTRRVAAQDLILLANS